MIRREEFQAELEELLGNDHVYFQPPENLKLKYPCIVYGLDDIYRTAADNKAYQQRHRYMVTYITTEPASPLVDRLIELPLCSFNRHFKSDGLNHYNYTIYY